MGNKLGDVKLSLRVDERTYVRACAHAEQKMGSVASLVRVAFVAAMRKDTLPVGANLTGVRTRQLRVVAPEWMADAVRKLAPVMGISIDELLARCLADLLDDVGVPFLGQPNESV